MWKRIVGGAVLVAAAVVGFPALTRAPIAFSRPPEPREAIVLFGGDMMFDRSVRVAMEEKGEDHVFSCLTLPKHDLFVANLEGPITALRSKSVGTSPGDPTNTRFTFATSVAPLLAHHGVAAVSLGNNHAQDFGKEGVLSTMEYLSKAGVGSFGDPLTEGMWKKELGGIRLAFIGYNAFQYLEDGKWSESTSTLHRIQEAKEEGYFPIVFAHWGDEYAPTNAEQKRLAHEWVDGGAALVIGAHPHVVQESEEYKGKRIYYSLGNLIFDQYFREEVRKGLLVRVVFDEKGATSFSETPTYLERDRSTCVAPAAGTSENS